MKKAKTMQCMICKQRGASFYCHATACRKMAHYRCAIAHQWFFNWENFTVFCPEEAVDLGHLQTQTNSTKTLTNRQLALGAKKMEMEAAEAVEAVSGEMEAEIHDIHCKEEF